MAGRDTGQPPDLTRNAKDNDNARIQWTPFLECRAMTRKPTIWESLATKLGREPSHAEACAEVKRILSEASDANLIARATLGTLPHQRKRK